MCYSFDDQAGIAILKYHSQYVLITIFVIVQFVFWYRFYLARKNGYEVKYSVWINLFHPFKFNKPIMTRTQK